MIPPDHYNQQQKELYFEFSRKPKKVSSHTDNREKSYVKDSLRAVIPNFW